MSTQIDYGIWKEPELLKNQMNFGDQDKIYSKEYLIENPVYYFEFHQDNFEQLFDKKLLLKTYQFHNWIDYHGEI
jgi:hypothetical protein